MSKPTDDKDTLPVVAWFTNTKKDGSQCLGVGDTATNEEYVKRYSDWQWEPLVRQSDAQRIRNERDELLDALKAVIAISDRKHDAWDAAKAAIAKATGN